MPNATAKIAVAADIAQAVTETYITPGADIAPTHSRIANVAAAFTFIVANFIV